MARYSQLATDAAINRIDLPERTLWSNVITLAVEDIRSNGKRKLQAQYFLVSDGFSFLCHALGLDKVAIQSALLPTDFIAKEGWREQQPMTIETPKRGRPRIYEASYYMRQKQRQQQTPIEDTSDAELFGIGFEEEPDPTPESIVFKQQFDSRSISDGNIYQDNSL